MISGDIPNPDNFDGDDGGEDSDGVFRHVSPDDFQINANSGWLSSEQLEMARSLVPIVCVEIVPVRVDDRGRVTSVASLTRLTEQDSGSQLSRTLITGRILRGETVRQAILRNVTQDLGAMALPQLPVTLQPFTVAEFFPAEVSPFCDPRQHAIALCYVIPISGDAQAAEDAVDVEWTDPTKMDKRYFASLLHGHDQVLRAGLAYAGVHI